MKIEKTVRVTLTTGEVENIIKNYLNLKHPEMHFTNISFNITTDYSDDLGGRGSEIVKEVICSGTLKD